MRKLREIKLKREREKQSCNKYGKKDKELAARKITQKVKKKL